MSENLEKAILEILSKSKNGLTFDEIYNALLEHDSNVKKETIRETLAGLVRRGIIIREPDYERKKMVFRIAKKC
ncbi:hypothetical protein Pyrde_1703 [Pyrodictium delaneyi]|uniref:Uncharacterized protein n=1 Tax=Pyrodictium delaneyi TaxID=1273541 RepID=A0A0P0N4C5_9CREN|nr:transcriptional repressor [Pyrodictium delaneyi]ALL01746.1 hypothetical protein Pyrde_1703 [Pyrodictium delaneyi]OWJ55033.1 hypothetical protein Pdsh_04895 [Pyrodictium delaneyi]